MFEFLDKLSETYTWPVLLKLPANGGKVTEVKFAAEFNRLSAEREKEISDETNARIKKIIQRAQSGIAASGSDDEQDDDVTQMNSRLLDEVLSSVGELDKAGNYTAADEDKKTALLSLRGATESILQAYGKSKSGEKAKN